jgi:hypothetical protein
MIFETSEGRADARLAEVQTIGRCSDAAAVSDLDEVLEQIPVERPGEAVQSLNDDPPPAVDG